MSGKKLAVSYLLLIALAIAGAWLGGVFSAYDPAKEVSGGELLLTVAGFFMLVGAIVGIVVLISRNRRPMSQGQRVLWEDTRAQGKRRYVGTYILRGSSIILAISLASILNHYWSGKPVTAYDLGINAAVALVFVGGVCYAAIRTWDYYEWEYHNPTQSTPRHNNSLGPTPR